MVSYAVSVVLVLEKVYFVDMAAMVDLDMSSCYDSEEQFVL
jgi:hypothetical protein